MYHHTQLVEKRIDRFVRERLNPAIYRTTSPMSISAWEVPDEPVPFATAMQQTFLPVAVGEAWGRPWGTVWFHVTGVVPSEWSATVAEVGLLVDLGFIAGHPGFQAEGLVYAPDGRIIEAIEPLNNYVPLGVGPGDAIDLYIEAAANPDTGESSGDYAPTPLGRKSTAGTERLYTLRRVDIVTRDAPVWELVQDIWTLKGLALELSHDVPRRAEIMRALDRVVDEVDPADVHATAPAGRVVLEPVLVRPASASAHRVFAVGHAHIDSAWLWPVRETIRKCARTFSNVLALMDEDPDFIFACSSAQQYAWAKQYYPGLFERIRDRVAEGRFVPVGGMWVESDTNMPGGEALARQFMEGKKFFIEEFGYEPPEVWLPDSFGYTAALPQIIVASGSRTFLTQKTSWNETNAFPHHTFLWEGIDGTRVFTHLPPVDSYSSDLSGADLARAQRNYAHKGQANTSLVPFGFGDGGGGPTREMMAAARRTRSLEGSPAVQVASPTVFFTEAQREYKEPAVWAGELYLEFHRGVWTSQARMKRGNRRSERLLHEAELWAATAAIRAGSAYPHAALQEAWRTVLLQQFHDILPGSSIGWVHDQAEEDYARVEDRLEGLIGESLRDLAGEGKESTSFNASPYPVSGVPAFGAAVVERATGIAVSRTTDAVTIDNGLVRIQVNHEGLIQSLIDAATGRDVIPAGTYGNLLQLFRDTPTHYDAWDIDKEYQRSGEDLVAVDALDVTEATDQRVTVRIVRSFGRSTVRQLVILTAQSPAVEIVTEVDWHERQKLLKLAFPVDVHASRAASEIQFGHVYRSTHTNTTWDTARFETPAHRWVHVSDASFGVAVANDSTYGHDITRSAREGGGTYTTVRQSLLRAPLFPDPEADQGIHVLRSSIVIGGIADAVVEGYRLNIPLRHVSGGAVEPLAASNNPAIVMETVKLAEDRSGDVIIRLYEAHGARSSAILAVSFEHKEVAETDLLERRLPAHAVSAIDARGVHVTLDPFQLVTLRFVRA
ncbi:MAG: alpha-mannosidase [Propionibacteriaceae bacterium]